MTLLISVSINFQERLNKVHEQAVKEAARRKPLLEPSPVSSPASVSTGLTGGNDNNQEANNDKDAEDSNK